jgi:hypothetical protein
MEILLTPRFGGSVTYNNESDSLCDEKRSKGGSDVTSSDSKVWYNDLSSMSHSSSRHFLGILKRVAWNVGTHFCDEAICEHTKWEDTSTNTEGRGEAHEVLQRMLFKNQDKDNIKRLSHNGDSWK